MLYLTFPRQGVDSLVDELSRTFLADLDGWVAVFRAYLDESGTHADSPAIAVAGYVARRSAWNRFVPKWRRTLSPIKVFHSTDCNGFYGEWKGWERAARDAKVARLLPLLPAIDGFGVAIGVVLRDVEEVLSVRPHLRRYWGNGYRACIQWCISRIRDRLHEAGRVSEPLAIVHERNQYKADAEEAYEWIKENDDESGQFISFSFGSKEKYVPLQAADILAYEVHKRLQNIEAKPRKSFEALMSEETEPRIYFYDKHNFGELIAALEMLSAYHEAETWEKVAPECLRKQVWKPRP